MGAVKRTHPKARAMQQLCKKYRRMYAQCPVTYGEAAWRGLHDFEEAIKRAAFALKQQAKSFRLRCGL